MFFLTTVDSSLLSCISLYFLSAYSTRQVKKMMHNIRQYQVPLQKYMAMMDLQVIVHLYPVFNF